MAAASAASAALVDPTKPEKYPVILSDALLGKPSKEVYTGVRYNHRPSDEPPSNARIKASTPGSGTFDLAFREADGTKYSYNGTRAADDRQFVLIFDPARRAFVLHRLDSLFNVNLIATPDNDDAVALREQHPYLSGHGVPPHLERKAAAATAPPPPPAKGAAAKKAAAAKKKAESASAAQKKKETAAAKKAAATQRKPAAPAPAAAPVIPLPEPVKEKAVEPPAPPSTKKKAKDADSDEEEEESDDEGGLLVEYPEGRPGPRSRTDFSPAFPPPQIRRFSEFIQSNNSDNNEEEEDADAEADPDDDVPDAYDQVGGNHGYNNGANGASSRYNNHDDDEDDDNEANNAADADDFGDLEGDLEAALEQELMDGAEESDISEED